MKKRIITKGILALASMLFATTFYAQESFGGLALYTVRENMGEDAKATLQKVADAGYAYIEAAGYADGKFYGMDPQDFKSYVESIGLTPVSTHMGGVTLENADQQIADTKAAGFEYFTIPVPPMGMFTFDPENRTMGMKGTMEDFAEILTTIGKKCEAAGLKLLYHNHDFEYKNNEDGIKPIVYLLENTDPKYVNFQMDLYWVTRAEADPVSYFEKYPGRFKLWHVKDMDEEGKFAPVGEGTIDFRRILDKKDISGMEKYFVEQDMTWDKKPLEVIKISHKGLKEIGFK
ncbi:sugar phosphate isomerase/epimerase [Muricauda ruestringensis]|uniref:Sugar phosphate isomerase/epimerase n=1 Tax=Flagellimonas aurea TaxID=2915619 RepID=A0ABS3G493_9FLAO|nr:sugar phosphate isomerase/epimerase [Allomuricauda aurea]MBO0353397.1 sugar phosphate isomerase/epimerase [Allomuricauda aurea]